MHEALKSSPIVNLNKESRYHISVKPAPPREPVPLRLLLVRNDDCIHCGICVDSCVYGVHERKPDLRMHVGTIDQQENVCRTCLRCVRECPKEALSVPQNPEFQQKAFGHWTAEIQASLLKQSETGKIPVSGAGYNGKFAGSGFDGIWTDMSEIVRPTRDGIHGRESISTAIVVGSRPVALHPDRLDALWSRTIELPVPFLFDLAVLPHLDPGVTGSIALAAERLNTLAFVRYADDAFWQNASPFSVPVFDAGQVPRTENRIQQAYMVELEYGEGFYQALPDAKKVLNGALLAVRMPFDPDRAVELASKGISVLHLMAERDGSTPIGHVSKALRVVHTALVDAGLRERVTLLAGGSVAAAEHTAKSILCGADGVTLDLTLLTALQVWNGGPPEESLDRSARIKPGWGVQRIQNLIASWRDQLLEILGAMGLREVRRLRGEVGRGLFFEELQKEFLSIFGTPLEIPQRPDFPANRVPRIRSRAIPVLRNFHNELSKFRVNVTSDCIQCGVCVHTCPNGVFEMPNGFNRLLPPRSSACIGTSCETKDYYCVPRCPTDAIRIALDETYMGMGDPRWTADLLISTYRQAESGYVPENSIESETGASDGGFDRIRICTVPGERKPARTVPDEVRTAIPLNRRKDGPQTWIPVPWYGGGMSYGSISLNVMLARAKAAQAFGTFMSTGEGGYPDPLIPYADHVITQVATGLFGVREDTIRRSRIVEFKYAQGAKPGLGGHLLADKVTAEVARMRGSLQWSSLFSPFPFHSVYSVEDHKKHLDWIRIIHPEALISVKVSTPSDVDMVAVGSYYAGANILQLDGSYGGTGAAPDIAKKNIAMPIEFAIPKVHKFLMGEGIRDEIVVLASGGVRTPLDIVKSIALGADGVVIGTAELVAIECDRCTNCERGRGCPFGIATSDPELTRLIDPDWAAQRIINMFHSWRNSLVHYLDRLGLDTLLELRGRTDLLEYVNE